MSVSIDYTCAPTTLLVWNDFRKWFLLFSWQRGILKCLDWSVVSYLPRRIRWKLRKEWEVLRKQSHSLSPAFTHLPRPVPAPLPWPCLPLPSESYSSSFLCPWGGHVTRPGDTGLQSWPVSPSWPQGLGRGWAHELSWGTAHVRSGTGSGTVRNGAPFS